MNREEIIEQQNAYYMAGYPSRRSENKMNKEHYQLTKAKEIIKNLIDDLAAIDGEKIKELKTVKEAEQFIKEVVGC